MRLLASRTRRRYERRSLDNDDDGCYTVGNMNTSDDLIVPLSVRDEEWRRYQVVEAKRDGYVVGALMVSLST